MILTPEVAVVIGARSEPVDDLYIDPGSRRIGRRQLSELLPKLNGIRSVVALRSSGAAASRTRRAHASSIPTPLAPTVIASTSSHAGSLRVISALLALTIPGRARDGPGRVAGNG